MTTIELRDITAEELGRKATEFLKDYWMEIVRVGGEHEQGIAKCVIAIQVSTVHPRTPHKVGFRMGLGTVNETRLVDQTDMLDGGGDFPKTEEDPATDIDSIP